MPFSDWTQTTEKKTNHKAAEINLESSNHENWPVQNKSYGDKESVWKASCWHRAVKEPPEKTEERNV